MSEINNVGIREDKRHIFNEMYRPKISYLNEEMGRTFDDMKFPYSPQFERIAKYFQMYSPYFFFDYNELLFLSNENRKKTPAGTCIEVNPQSWTG